MVKISQALCESKNWTKLLNFIAVMLTLCSCSQWFTRFDVTLFDSSGLVRFLTH